MPQCKLKFKDYKQTLLSVVIFKFISIDCNVWARVYTVYLMAWAEVYDVLYVARYIYLFWTNVNQLKLFVIEELMTSHSDIYGEILSLNLCNTKTCIANM